MNLSWGQVTGAEMKVDQVGEHVGSPQWNLAVAGETETLRQQPEVAFLPLHVRPALRSYGLYVLAVRNS
jgi:hypothetical protein